MRPVGDITRAMAKAWSEGPAPVAVAAQRACVGFQAARYTASRMVARGDLVVLHAGRPAVLALPGTQPEVTSGCMRAMELIDSALHRWR